MTNQEKYDKVFAESLSLTPDKLGEALERARADIEKLLAK